MPNINNYEDLVKLAQEQRDEKIRLKGSLDNIVSTLKSLGYKSIKDARLALVKKQTLLNSKIGERDKKLAEFNKNYGHLINQK